MLHDGSEGVTMSHHDDLLVLDDLRADLIVPVGQHPVDSDLKRLSLREYIEWHVLIALIVDGVSLVLDGQLGWWDVIAASPDCHLVLTVLRCRLCLVKALKSSVVTLVESPVLVDRDPVAVQLRGQGVEGSDGTSEHGCETHIESESVLLEELPCKLGLRDTVGAQGDICPPCETVLFVPGRLSMSHKDNLVNLSC